MTSGSSRLSDRDRRDILKLMARVAEQVYHRGAQQGAGLAQRPCFRANLGEWRYETSLDLSPWVDTPRMTTSLERLDGECGEETTQDRLSARAHVISGLDRRRKLLTNQLISWVRRARQRFSAYRWTA